jgi:hypothetical protein
VGKLQKAIKLVFYNNENLKTCKQSLGVMIERNQKNTTNTTTTTTTNNTTTLDGFFDPSFLSRTASIATGGGGGSSSATFKKSTTQESQCLISEMREHDIAYYSRVMIDKGISSFGPSYSHI